MSASHFDIEYVANLARIELAPEEKVRLGSQLEHILSYIEQLREVDVSNVEPTAHAIPVVNVTRADEPVPSLPHDDALRNAPQKAGGLFVVPKVVE